MEMPGKRAAAEAVAEAGEELEAEPPTRKQRRLPDERAAAEAVAEAVAEAGEEFHGAYKYFSSGSGIGEFSNFCALEHFVEFNGRLYPTTEHLYQAEYRCEEEDRHRFAEGGDLASMETGMALVVDNKDKVASKIEHWSAKGNRPAMPGIVAKMAVHPKRAEHLKIKLRKSKDDPRDMDEIKRIFKAALLSKYRRNPLLRCKLVATWGVTLIEFDRMAKHHSEAGRPPLWTGMVKDGKLYGQNLMGKMMMEVRDQLAGEVLVPWGNAL
jgi:predicted NAD-dependent protein-ADP-ribosyltransferase YbiA (DUF1768 family)